MPQQPSLLDRPRTYAPSSEGVQAPRFDGPDLDPSDHVRLGKQLAAVLGVMADAHWRTLREIADAAGCPEASASARLRDLRKFKHGAYTVERRRVEPGTGLWTYRLMRSA